jgi:dihydroorotase
MSVTLIKNAVIINEGKQISGSILIVNERIEEIIPEGYSQKYKADHLIDAHGKYLIPGVIDDHVHFREPGLTSKGDIFTESKAAVAGGVTSFMDMPNTNPQTVTQELLKDKFALAETSSLTNYSFYIGATNNNLDELLKTNPGNVCGIKVFMGSSTGNMLVDEPGILREIFSQTDIPVAVHCENETIIRENLNMFRQRFGEDIPVYFHPVIRNAEACYKSSRMAVELAEKYNSRLHILHLSTAAELNLLKSDTSRKDKRITAEVCVQYLMFDEGDYFTHGNIIKWNPAIKSKEDKEALIKALLDGTIDVVASDHAPHTLADKKNTYFKAPSGGPMVQHTLVAMLELYRNKGIHPERIVDKMCHAPADIFKIKERGYIRKGFYADLVIVDPYDTWTVSEDNILYKCKWSPLLGMTFSSRITHTFVNGHLIYDEGHFNEDIHGQRLIFDR